MERIAPFYVGQEVEAIKDHSQGAFKKGDRFKITSVEWGCCQWKVTVGIHSILPFTHCLDCKSRILSKELWIFNANCFRSITPEFQSISLSKVLEIETPLIGIN